MKKVFFALEFVRRLVKTTKFFARDQLSMVAKNKMNVTQKPKTMMGYSVLLILLPICAPKLVWTMKCRAHLFKSLMAVWPPSSVRLSQQETMVKIAQAHPFVRCPFLANQTKRNVR